MRKAGRKSHRTLGVGLCLGLALLGWVWVLRGERARPFRIEFTHTTNDPEAGPVAVFRLEHDLPYNLGAMEGWYIRQGPGGRTNRYAARASAPQFPAHLRVRYQVPLPPEGGRWRYVLEMALPGNPGFEEKRPLEVRLADGVASRAERWPVPPSWKARCERWTHRVREASSQPFETPTPLDPVPP